MLVFLLVVLTFLSCSTEGKEHVTCKRTFNKIGCFKEKKIVTIPLVNDRDKRPDQDTGYVITWHEIEEYLHSLACRCAAKAKENNLEYFGIRFYGECYGGNSALTKVEHASNACFQGISYGKCNDTNIKECGGQANADYIYKMISDESQDVDGGYSEWGAWSACSEECGGGLKRRNRACNNPVPKGAGKDCSSLGNETELAHCAVQPCPVDGGFSEWSLYGECSKKCGGGFQNRTRTCNNPSPAHGGKNCEGALIESVSCNDSPCAVDGQFTDWSVFGACNVKCGKGLQYRNRTCTNPPPSNGGKDCLGSYKDSRECFSGHCPVDGGYSGWKASGSCTKSCGGGDQLFIRTCDNPAPQHGGSDCSAIGPDSEQRQCNNQPCPVDGGFSEWSKFGSCSVSCGSGFKYRTRLCNNPLPAYNGTDCVGDLREALHCVIEHCKVDGGFSEWSAYGTCSVSCGGGLQFSTRACSNPFPSNGGSACAGATKKSRRCNTKRCPVNGGFSNWSSWGRCSRSCGPGNQYRRRRCNNPIPRYGGKACTGNYRESQSCNLKPCPVHGGYGPWSAYGSCSATCGHGHQHRSRQCNSPRPSHGGRGCTVLGPSTERRVCHKKRCPSPVSPEYLSRVCEHSTLSIRCPAGSHIRISSALYGRRTKAYCRSGWMLFARTNCAARSSLHHVNARCKNRQYCSVPAKNWLFGDPCIFTYKYLEVRHRCFGSTAQLHSAKVCEFKTRTISCPFGRQIQIVNAMYGRLNRKDCPYHKHTTTTNCKASSSLQKTKSACDGKHSCVLKASNGVYGDPCIYVHKYLDVKYKCIW
eukprot:gene11287-12468_t